MQSRHYIAIDVFFKRKIYNRILEWKKGDGKYALLIEGARRIGKSTIVRQFAENEYQSYVFVDFSNAKEEINELFRNMHDLDYFFLRLQTLYNVTLTERKSLIVFDEVQFEPRARQAIKHLVADGRYDYIETGSLISIRKNVKDILIPSEEERIQMYPMDYEEFLWAIGKRDLPELLRQIIASKKPIGDSVNREMMKIFRLYMLVGGMPQAVEAYLQSNSLSEVDKVKRKIIDLYENDLIKIDPTGRISALFNSIPAQLANNITHFHPHASAEADSNAMQVFINELAESKTVNVCYHTTDPRPMLATLYDMKRFKMYVTDTGLFVTLAFKNSAFTENIIYRKLLTDKLEANLGYVYENAVAQILTTAGKRIYYHTFPNANDTKKYEVDFLIADNHKIMPLEVKSSGYTRYASLEAFVAKYSSKISQAYCISPKDRAAKENVVNLPFYLLPFLFE